MGPHRDAPELGGTSLTRIAQVVPDLPTFAVDDGFAYEVPDDVAGIEIGSVVRIPLGGRRVGGYVVRLREGRPSRPLRPITGRSGELAVFDRRGLETLRWVALHHVVPLAMALRLARPPNNPRPPTGATASDHVEPPAPFETLGNAPGVGTTVVVTGRFVVDTVAWAVGTLEVGASALVVTPTVDDAGRIGAALRAGFGARVVVAHSGLPNRERTAAWARFAATPGTILVGTRETALWPSPSLGLAVVVEDGRRALVSPQMPTYRVREVLRRRAAVERLPLVLVGPVPTVEALAAGPTVWEQPGRIWPVVEVVDRTEEPPGSPLVSERVRMALRRVVAGGGRAFVLTRRRGDAPALRCVACGTVRRCGCGATGVAAGRCGRCGAEVGACGCGGRRFEALGAAVGAVVDDLRRSLGGDVGDPQATRPVTVGTVRDLPPPGSVDLAVCVDTDAFVFAPNHTAAEDALRVLARLALAVAPGRGRRAMVQTTVPDHRVLRALRRGRPLDFLTEELDERRALGLPPAVAVLAVDTDGDAASVDADLRRLTAGEGEVLGPLEVGSGRRWLLRGAELRRTRIRLRGFVQELRDGGATVRIEVDPVDL